MVIQWREGRGWYHIWFSDSQAALGDYTEDLPGSLPLMATPEQVAGAIQALVPERCQCGGGNRRTVPRLADAPRIRGRTRPARKTTGGTCRPGPSGR